MENTVVYHMPHGTTIIMEEPEEFTPNDVRERACLFSECMGAVRYDVNIGGSIYKYANVD